MAKTKINPIYFEYRAIQEDLEDIEGLDPAHVMRLQVRLCELKMEIAAHEKNMAEERKTVYRKKPTKKRFAGELSDLVAFRHLLTNREAVRKYPVGTINGWADKLSKGIVPSICEKLLKENGYSVFQIRKWKKPKARK